LAFSRRALNPSITVRYVPLGVGGGLGNALIEINSSLPWRYGPGGQQSSTDLVTALAHEIGHKLDLDHSDDPQSIMYYNLSNQRNVRTLPDVDIQAINELRGRPDVIEATNVHGTSVSIEDPDRIEKVLRRGQHTRGQALNTVTWFHFAPPTPARTDGRRLRLHAVRLKVQTQEQIRLAQVHVWDGSSLLQVHLLDLKGDGGGGHLWDLRLGVARKPLVRDGISISINVDFVNAGSHQMDFISAGCEFVPGGSLYELPPELEEKPWQLVY
jgi:Family of unknown function (DUF6623)/Matrixin